MVSLKLQLTARRKIILEQCQEHIVAQRITTMTMAEVLRARNTTLVGTYQGGPVPWEKNTMSKKKPASFAPYFATADADQVRAAFLATGQLEGYASISELIEQATLKEVRRLQRKYHNVKPWEGAGPGSLRPGQRTRTEQHPKT